MSDVKNSHYWHSSNSEFSCLLFRQRCNNSRSLSFQLWGNMKSLSGYMTDTMRTQSMLASL